MRENKDAVSQPQTFIPTNTELAKNSLHIYKVDVYTIDQCLWDL